MVEYHRQLLAQAIAAGGSPSSEAVLGESLTVISYTWLAEVSSAQHLADAVDPNGALTTQYHHGVGIAAQTAIQQSGKQGPYVDLPLNFITMEPETHYAGSGIPPSVLGAFLAVSGVSSSLESAVLEQTQALTAGMTAASTVRLVDMNAATGAKTFFADGTTSTGVAAYFSSIQPLLTNYSSSSPCTPSSTTDLCIINYLISSNGTASGNPTGNQVLIPLNGGIQVGYWTGAGYTSIAEATSSSGYTIKATQKITGGLTGGYSGSVVPTPTLTDSTVTELPPTGGNSSIPSAAVTSPPASTDLTTNEPVDAITGAYVYRHTDLVTGGGAFPYALSFTRHYTSSSNGTDLGLGDGWTSGYSIAASRTSDPYRGLGFAAPVGAPAAIAASADMGENSAIDSAAAVAAMYVSKDLLSVSSETAKQMTVAWMVSRWLTDQLTNNAVIVAWPATSEEFTLLPHADGAASAAYSPPIGSAVVLTGSVPDTYGNFTSFAYRMKNQELITFSPIGSAADGQIASWVFPDGMSVSFAYNYGYDGASYLTNVANNLGRSLTLAYSGGHVSGVTDDTGREITYSYNGSDLASYIDPLGAVTSFAYDTTGTYDTAGHLTQISYPSEPGTAFVTNSYDGLGRISRQANADGAVSSFYLAGSRTELVDAAGGRHVTYQTPGGRIIEDPWVLSSTFGDVFNDTPQQNGVVNVASNHYDGLDRLILATLPEGGTTAYTWSPDLQQNVIAVTQTAKPGSPLSPLTTTYTYDPTYNKPTSITDPRGLVTTMSYDAFTGNLLSRVANAGPRHFNATSCYTYSGHGQVLTATDPLGVVTSYSYDGFSNLITIVRDSGVGRLNQTTRMSYSALGDVVSLTDPNGNVTISNYDADRRLTETRAPPAPFVLLTALTYDLDGRLLATRKSANGAVLATTTASYTPTGKLATATDADGNVTRYAYDAADRLASTTDAAGRVTTYAYHAMGRQIAVSNVAIQAAPLHQWSYTPDGLVGGLIDANANTTSFAYDGFDRLSITSYPDASAETLS